MEPLQLLPRDDDGKLSLNEAALSKVLEPEEVRNRELVVVAAVGAFRRGKSFFLNYLLRFLRKKRRDDWLDDLDAALTGFHWRGGAERDTEGILLWPEAFLIGDDLAVLILDTQGTFDNRTVVRDNMVVFAVTTLLSSQLIYNISSQIQLDILQNLQCFLEYGRMVKEESDVKPFQNLLLLVRDWMHSTDFGFKGGEEQLQKWMKDNEINADKDKASATIEQCFSDVKCFLMPTPGDDTCAGQNTTGALSGCSKNFQTYLPMLVENLLTCKLPRKMIGDKPVIAKEFPRYARAYFDSLNRNDVPNPTSIFESTVNTNNTILAMEAKQMYVTDMQKLCEAETSIPDFEVHHQTYMEQALQYFDEKRKLGGDVMARNFRENLVEELHSHGKLLQLQNEKRMEQESQSKIEAELQNQLNLSKKEYESAMDSVCDKMSSVPKLDELHKTEKEKVLKSFQEITAAICSDGEVLQGFATNLKNFFDAKISRYESLNNLKIEKEANENSNEKARISAATCIQSYRAKMTELCLSSELVKNLTQRHDKVKSEVVSEFDTDVSVLSPDIVTPFRQNILKEIEHDFKSFEKQENQKRQGVELRVTEKEFSNAKQTYSGQMNELCGGTSSIHNLILLEKDIRAKILKHFDDLQLEAKLKETYRAQLLQDLDKLWSSFKNSNDQKAAKEEEQKFLQQLNIACELALSTYQTHMDNKTSTVEPVNIDSLHSEALENSEKCYDSIAKHVREEDLNLAKQANKSKCTDLKKHYKKMNDMKINDENKKKVETALSTGHKQYNELMERACLDEKPVTDLTDKHNSSINGAISFVKPLVKFEKESEVLNQLKKLCEKEFTKYEERNKLKIQKAVSNEVFTKLEDYKKRMNHLCQMGINHFERDHKKAKNDVIYEFRNFLKNIDPENVETQVAELDKLIMNEYSVFENHNKQILDQKLSDGLSEISQAAINQLQDELETASSGCGYQENWNAVVNEALSRAKQKMLDAYPDARMHKKYQEMIENCDKIVSRYETANNRKHVQEKADKKQKLIVTEIENSFHRYELLMRESISLIDENAEFKKIDDEHIGTVVRDLKSKLRSSVLPEELLESENLLRVKIGQSSTILKNLFQSALNNVVEHGVQAKGEIAITSAIKKLNEVLNSAIFNEKISDFQSNFSDGKKSATELFQSQMAGRNDQNIEERFQRELDNIYRYRWQQASLSICNTSCEKRYAQYERDFAKDLRKSNVGHNHEAVDPKHKTHQSYALNHYRSDATGCEVSVIERIAKKLENNIQEYWGKIDRKIDELSESYSNWHWASLGLTAIAEHDRRLGVWRQFVADL